MKPSLRKTVAAAALAAALLAGASIVFREEIAGVARFSASRRVLPWNVRIGRFDPDRELELRRSDGVPVAASVYEPTEPTARATIVLLHGNTPLGSRLPVYRVLSTKLAERGYRVLALDLAGFGRSGDPFEPGSLESLNADLDVEAALDRLTADGAAGSPIVLLGHSGGAASAMGVGMRDRRVAGIVAMGPPRRTAERLADPRQRDYFWNRALETRRTVYGRGFPAWYTPEVWLARVLGAGDCTSLQVDMGQFLPYFSGASHKPLLLVDGAREAPADQRYLKQYFEAMTEPKALVTLAGSDHYCNTGPLRSGVVYDARVVRWTVDAIDAWVARITSVAPPVAPAVTENR